MEVTDPDGLADETQGPAVAHRYLHGPAVDQVLAVEDPAGDVLWGLGDHQQTVREVVDSAGNLVEHRKYDSFGNLTGPLTPAVDYLFAYTGRPLDTDTHLYDYRARWYDPAVGRFVTEDPIGFAAGDANFYRYCGNSPVVNVDPSGLCFTGFSPEPVPWDYATEKAWNNAFLGHLEDFSMEQRPRVLAESGLTKGWAYWDRQATQGHIQRANAAHAAKRAADEVRFARQSLKGKVVLASIPDGGGWRQHVSYFADSYVDIFTSNQAAAGNAVRNTIDASASYVEEQAIHSGSPILAGVTGYYGSGARIGAGMVGGIVDLPGTFSAGVDDVYQSVEYADQFGVRVGVARQIGLLQFAEAGYGIDVRTGGAVDWTAKVSEGSARFGGTAATLAGGLRLTGIGVGPGVGFAPKGASVNPAFQKGFSSHSELVKYLGPAGKGRAWHHIVEQTPANIAKFGPEKIHNINNMVNVAHGKGLLHNKISGFFSSRAPGGGRIRDWLGTKSFEEQYDFGTRTIGKLFEP